MALCQRCEELREAARRADAAGDHSRAVDCRVLIARHCGVRGTST
ncbi:hypothetical protein [Streptomyces sp. CA-253872]